MPRILVAVCVTLSLALPGAAVVNLTLGQDIDWPPYAYAAPSGALLGFGKDIADGMSALCADVNIRVVKVPWADCWTSDGGGSLGQALENGSLDGCLTYTHTFGVRQKYAEFSHAISTRNAAGLMTMLNSDGTPKVDGKDDLTMRKVVDVGGWAPTSDSIHDVTNQCTNAKYAESLNLKIPDVDGNDAAMQMLRNGQADAMYVYSNQAQLYQNCEAGATVPWNCDLWRGFGSEYAYVQTGQFDYAENGTTLVMAKKGTGKAAAINECLAEFMATEAYFGICQKYDMLGTCYPNSHFPEAAAVDIWSKPTSEQTGDCSDGYCPCSVTSSTPLGANAKGSKTTKAAMASNAEGSGTALAFFLSALVKVVL